MKPRSASRLAATLIALSLPLMAAPAYARPERPALHWVRGAGALGCIDPRSLARRVEDITGPAFVPAAQADVSIEAYIQSTAQGSFTLSMRLVSRSAADGGERVVTFSTSDCRTLDASIAFLIATAIDPSLGAEGVPPELSWTDESESAANAEALRRELAKQAGPAPVSTPAQAPSTVTPAEARPAASPLSPRPWQLGVAALSGNGLDAGFAAGLMIDLSRVITARLAITAQLSGESAFSSRELPSATSVLTQRTAAALLACSPLPLTYRYELRGCAGPELGAMLSHGYGFASNRTSALSTAGVLARIELRHDIAQDWMVSAGVSFHSILQRPHVYYERANERLEAFRVVPWLVQVALGVVYRL